MSNKSYPGNSFCKPESLGCDVCLPECVEGGEERGHRLKYCNRTIEAVEDFLNQETIC